VTRSCVNTIDLRAFAVCCAIIAE